MNKDKDKDKGDIVNELLPVATKEAIANIEKTGDRPYSETKKILDAATKETIKNLSIKKRERFSPFSK